METDPLFRRYRERQDRFHKRLEDVRAETDSILDSLGQQMPTSGQTSRLESLRAELERLLYENVNQAGSFIEHLRKVEVESNRRTAMAEKRAQPQKNQDQIEQLCEELTTKLRLDRIDDAIKELLDFLADAGFFAANASTGRRRRLRTLQNAIEKALTK